MFSETSAAGSWTRPRRSLRRRLIAVTLLSSVMVTLMIGGAVFTYMFFEEREEVEQHLATQTALIATQSAAAIVFDDREALAENLAQLSLIDSARWASISRDGRELARFGGLPHQLAELVRTLAADPAPTQRTERNLDGIVMRRPIEVNGRPVAALTVALSFAAYNRGFLTLIAYALLLLSLAIAVALPMVYLALQKLTRPLAELTNTAQLVIATGVHAIRAPESSDDEIGDLAIAFNRMLEAQEKTQATLQSLVDQGTRIREEERSRIAREVHDELGQLMTRLKFDAAWINGHADEPAVIRARTAEMAEVLDRSIDAVRRIAWELRPGVLDTAGLSAAIEWLGGDFARRTGIACQIDADGLREPAGAECATHAFRICQELLTNVARHARAHAITILLSDSMETLTLIVEDDGIGLQAADDGRPRLGLQGIRERARSVGGSVEINTRPDFEGTCVTVRLPLPPAKPVAGNEGQSRVSGSLPGDATAEGGGRRR